ncbi:MAG TPA: hypothetical protein VM532_00515 [Burkholderiales bacterium]|nr:hypothetical protein [Burkholderiales bacterium]
MPLVQEGQEVAMLRTEIEMLVQERNKLLQVAGAAAVFIANSDIRHLPKPVFDAADVLATCVNSLREETLRDALEAVNAEVAVDTPERRRLPRED